MSDRNLSPRSDTVRPPVPAPRGGADRPASRSFAPGELRFTATGDRQARWDALGDALRQKLIAWAGQPLEWWAAEADGGRTSVVLLGTTALCTADPRTGPAGRGSHTVRRIPLDPASFAHLEVEHAPQRTSRWSRRSGPLELGAGAAGLAVLPPPVAWLRRDADASAFLGTLPPRAQTFLLAPFTDPADRVACRYYYEDTSTMAAARLGVWCCLIGLRSVTFAAGTRTQDRGRRAPTRWRVMCRRAGIHG